MDFGVLPHLRTSHGGALWVGLLSLMVAGVSSPAMAQNEDLFGRWDPRPGDCIGPVNDPDCYIWPLTAIHAAHLPTDRILIWEGGTTSDPPRLWNTSDGTFTTVPTEVDSAWLFCSGHAALADGSILVAGGGVNHAGDFPRAETLIFLLRGKGGWQQVEDMNFERWYPTCTSLPDGSVLATSGYHTVGPVEESVPIPEIFDPGAVGPIGTPGTWTMLPGSA